MGDYDDDFEDYDEDFEEEPIEIAESKVKVIKSNNEVQSKATIASNSQKQATGGTKSATSISTSVTKPALNKESSFSSKYAGKFTSSISLGDSIGITPHLRRLKGIYDSNVLDLQEERFNQLNILPTTVIDLYYRQLKGTASNSKTSGTSVTDTNPVSIIRQLGITTREETRDVEIMTDEILYADKEMQFSYGNDDTDFLNTLRSIKQKGKGAQSSKGSYSSSSNSIYNKSNSKNESTEDLTSSIYGAPKLSTFLHKSSMLIELILEESRIHAEGSRKVKMSKSYENSLDTLGRDSTLDHNSSWLKMGEPERSGSLELIAFRKINVVTFSPLQPNLVLTSHPYPLDENQIANELKPFSGLFCIWDMSSSSAPIYILESSGQPLCCNFSASQSFIVVAGMDDGTISMWNLLESDSIHKDRDSKDLSVVRGIRKPCFNTFFSNAMSEVENAAEMHHHFAAVTQIEAFKYGVTGNDNDLHYSQFVSIDITGKVIFWMTQQVSGGIGGASDSTSDNNDFSSYGNKNLGLSPWGNIMLVSVRSLVVDFLLDSYDSLRSVTQGGTNGSNQTNNNNKSKSAGNSLLFQQSCSSIASAKMVLGIVPNDMSTLYLSANNGKIQRLSKYHSNSDSSSARSTASNTLHPNYYIYNTRSSTDMKDWISMSVCNDQTVFSTVVSVSIQENFIESNTATNNVSNSNDRNIKVDEILRESILGKCSLVLVGRLDGSIDLFGADDGVSCLLHTWNTTNFKLTQSSSVNNITVEGETSVVALKWCPMRASAFFALLKDGTLLYFDIISDLYTPIHSDMLPYNTTDDHTILFDISVPKYSNSSIYIAMNFKNKHGVNTIQLHKLSNISIKLCKSVSDLVNENKTLRASLLGVLR